MMVDRLELGAMIFGGIGIVTIVVVGAIYILGLWED